MKMVIDIPEDVKAVIDRKGTNETVAETLWQAVKNGTPLQEGHVRLIDADKIVLTDFGCLLCNGDYKEALKMLDDKIKNAPAIIEAYLPDTDAGNNDRNCEACKHHHEGGCDSWECEEEAEG